MQGVLDGCGEIDNQCYQDVNEILNSADLEIDGSVNRRGLVALLSKTFKAFVGVFLDITSILITNWKIRQQEVQEEGLWLPDAKASDAGAVASATEITVSAGGALVVTITQTSVTTSLQG